MGKIIARKIRGMNLWAKAALITLCTLLVSVFMYEGLYKPKESPAATLTYYVGIDTATNLSADGTCNVTGLTPYTSTGIGKTTTRTTEAGTGYRYYPTVTAGSTATVFNVYTPVYATATDISGISASAALRGLAATDTVKLDLYDYDPAGAPNNGTLVASSVAKTLTGGTATTQYTWVATDFTVNGTGRVAAGHRLQFRFTWYSATSGTPRVYFGLAGALTSTNFTVTETPVTDTTSPSVTINQAGGQADPTSTSPINFTVVFSEPVSNFATGDVTIGGTAGGTKTATVTGSGTTYNVAVTGMTTTGTVTASLASGVASDAAGNLSLASTSTDNSVTWNEADTTAPSVTIEQAAAQTDPTSNSPINFTVVFSESVSNFATGDVTIGGTAGGTKTATVTGSGTTYNVAVTGMTTSGTVTASLAAGVASDAAGNPSLASTSTDNSVTWNAAVNNTTASALTYSAIAADSITVTAPYTGDSNANNSCVIAWGTTAGTYPNTASSSKVGSSYVATVSGLNANTTYYFRATFTDADGVTGSPVTGSQATSAAPAINSPLMHNAQNTASTKSGGTWGNNKDCTWCHSDGSTNIKQVAVNVTKLDGTIRPVYFQRMTTSVSSSRVGIFGDDSRTYDVNASRNVCEVCHHQTKFHQYSSTKVADKTHYNRKDCITCHAHAKAFKASCDSCHMSTPTSGSHTVHAVNKAMACATCHYNSVGNGASHNNTLHSFGFWINGTNVPGFAGDATSKFATYSANTSSPADSSQANTLVRTAAAGRGSCNVYCHGNWTGAGGSLNAQWGAGPSQDACGTCHAATVTPNQPTAWPTTGAHARHAGNGANQMKLSCDKCHGAHTDNTHVTGTVKWDVSALSGSTPQYRATTGNTAYIATGATGGVAPSAAYGQCTNIYCHSSGQNPTNGTSTGVVYAQPTWGPTGLTCGSCHTDMRTVTATGGSASSHNEHANASTGNYDCAVCHAGYNATTASYPSHVNSAIDVAISATYGGTYNGGTAVANGYGTCSNTYCHSNGTNTVTPAANTSVAWGGTTACGSCHGNPPSYTGGKANSHVQHVTTGGYSCDYCHVKTTANGTTIASRARHANKFYNISANTAKTLTFSYNSGTLQCSNSQCHATPSPVWGANTNSNTCTKCHGTASTNGTNANMAPNVGAHQVHVHGTGSYSYSSELTCYECHNSGATANFTNHMNGSTQNVVFTNASTAQANAVTGTWTAGTYPNGTCSVYCHGVSMPRGDTSGTARTNVTWTANLMTGAKANDCALCHGNPPTTGTTVSTHSGQAATTSCTNCHAHFNATGDFDTEANRRLHIDGTLQAKGDCNACHNYDVVGSTYAASTWSGGYWGNSNYDGLTPGEGAGAHAKHINAIKTRLGIAAQLTVTNQTYGAAGSENVKVCGTCHTINIANHMVGSRMINFGDSAFLMGGTGGTSLLFGATNNPAYNGVPGTSKSTTPKTCSNLSCHYFTTPNW